jgi:hypothetical protein
MAVTPSDARGGGTNSVQKRATPATPIAGQIEFGDLLVSLTQEVPLQQERLDLDYLRQLALFRALIQESKKRGVDSIARAVAPARMVAQTVQVESQFHFAQSTATRFSLGIRLLNLGYRRRYAHTEFAESRLQVTVQQVPYRVHD